MYSFVVIIICSLWMLYNSMTYFVDLPFIMLMPNTNMFIRGILSAVLKWSLPLGIIGLIFGILCVINYRRLSEDVHYYSLRLMIFFVIMSICLFF